MRDFDRELRFVLQSLRRDPARMARLLERASDEVLVELFEMAEPANMTDGDLAASLDTVRARFEPPKALQLNLARRGRRLIAGVTSTMDHWVETARDSVADLLNRACNPAPRAGTLGAKPTLSTGSAPATESTTLWLVRDDPGAVEERRCEIWVHWTPEGRLRGGISAPASTFGDDLERFQRGWALVDIEYPSGLPGSGYAVAVPVVSTGDDTELRFDFDQEAPGSGGSRERAIPSQSLAVTLYAANADDGS